jgi:transcriptional regulator with XRE-family HTH domain
MKSFADRLREARVALGMTQEQLGFAVGLTKSSISAWENSRETPSFHTLPKLREVLHLTLDELVCGQSPAASGSAIRDQRGEYAAHEGKAAARDAAELALLTRYRSLPGKRRAALLELLKPES